MLLDIKAKLDDTSIIELIETATYPDSEHIASIIDDYTTDPELEILGYFLEEQVIGIIGYRMNENRILEIRHIAVSPEERLHGFGRGMILEVLTLEEPKVIIVKTDEINVNFYRSIGFRVESLGDEFPGVERYKCIYEADIDEDLSED